MEIAVLTLLAAVASERSGLAWLVPVGLAAPLVAVELWFDSRSRGRRLAPELCGAVGIGASAPAIALAGGADAGLAAGLWLVLAARSVAVIPFVRVQIARMRRGHGPVATDDWAQVAGATVALAAVAVKARGWRRARSWCWWWRRSSRGGCARRSPPRSWGSGSSRWDSCWWRRPRRGCSPREHFGTDIDRRRYDDDRPRHHACRGGDGASPTGPGAGATRPRLLLRRPSHRGRRQLGSRAGPAGGRPRAGGRKRRGRRRRRGGLGDHGRRRPGRPHRGHPPPLPVGRAAPPRGAGRQGRRRPRRSPPRAGRGRAHLRRAARRPRTAPGQGGAGAVPHDPRAGRRRTAPRSTAGASPTPSR